MLDIDTLRLFGKESWPYLEPGLGETADAQLAKTAWGIQAWLGEIDLELAADLAGALEQANIERRDELKYLPYI